jgi:hypothetical protein
MTTPVGSIVNGRWNILEILVNPSKSLTERGVMYLADGVSRWQANNSVNPDRTFLNNAVNSPRALTWCFRADAGGGSTNTNLEIAECIFANVEATPFRLAAIRNYYAQEWGLKYY